MAVTRRALLNAMARLGGAGAVYETLAVWDFLKPPPALAAGLEIPRESGAGKTVAVLGAGVAGLCAAYELDRAGYDCIVLEASRRLGGRSLTVRRGDSFREVDGPLQECAFEEGQYLNAGPGRIPHHHVHVIDYCRQFGVALQPFIFASRANLVHTGHLGNGRTMPVRRALYDLQGHVAELLDKCIAKGGIDQPVTGVDLERLREMLAKFGGLTKVETQGEPAHWVYRNATGRAGYEVPPGVAGEPGRPLGPMALDEILRSNVWDDYIFRDAEYYWQTSLLEPVGGMDNFVKGFARQPLARSGSNAIEGLIRYGAKVTAIEVGVDKVAIRYDQGGARTLTADYCVSTIPMPIFRELRTNLPSAYMQAARALPVQAAGKVGWQADRFWETKDQIYGGISWTTDDITQIWYPSHGYLSRKGTLTGAYLYGSKADHFNALPVAERLHIARQQGERLHPGFADAVEHGLAIAWNRMEFERFAWADESDPGFPEPARALSAPQGRFHMAGDQITWWSGWQEGAVISAWEAVKSIDRQTHPTATRP
jgi:monoamine oxidase